MSQDCLLNVELLKLQSNTWHTWQVAMPSALTQNVVSQKILSICVVQVSDFSHRHLLGGYWKGNGFTLSGRDSHLNAPIHYTYYLVLNKRTLSYKRTW